jgi:hypothetical protein
VGTPVRHGGRHTGWKVRSGWSRGLGTYALVVWYCVQVMHGVAGLRQVIDGGKSKGSDEPTFDSDL